MARRVLRTSGSGTLFHALQRALQRQLVAWGLVLNDEFGNDHFLSLVSRLSCLNDVDTGADGILRAKQSSKSAEFFGRAAMPYRT